MFFQRPGRDDNGNVEIKPVCSGLLHLELNVTSPDHLNYLLHNVFM